MFKIIFSIVFILSLNARDLTIGSGGKSGNYFTVANDIVETCSNDIKTKFNYDLKNISTSGSVENLNGILRKKYSIGFVQQDVYEYFKKKDQLNTIELNTKKMMYLYPEYLTILIPKGWKPKSNSIFSKFTELFNSHKPISIMSLKNQTVYAKGGALVSSQALSFFMNLHLNIIDATNHTINGPFIFVTGAGDSRIQQMLASGKWFLLSFNGNELSNRAGFYKTAQVTYIVNGKTQTANTVSIMSVMYARNYRSKKRKSALKELKQCIKNNIDDLIDDGQSDKWSLISRINGWDNQGDNEGD